MEVYIDIIFKIIWVLATWAYCRWATERGKLPMKWWAWVLALGFGGVAGVLIYGHYRRKNRELI